MSKCLRLRDYFSTEEAAEIFDILTGMEVVLTSKQLDWSMDLEYRYGEYGMDMFCTPASVEFLKKIKPMRDEQHEAQLVLGER